MAWLRNSAFIFAMTVLMWVLAEEIQLYSDKYDNFDVIGALNNDTIRNSYQYCYLGRIPCQTDTHKIITGKFSEAYMTNCKKCTEKQKVIYKEVENWYKLNLPEEWKLMVEKAVNDMMKKAN